MEEGMLLRLCVSIFVLTFVNGEPSKRYDGHSVIRVVPTTPEQLLAVADFQHSINNFAVDVWHYSTAINRPLDVQVSPESFAYVMGKLKVLGLNPRVMIADVQAAIDQQRPLQERLATGNFNYSVYHTIREINAWVDMIVTQHQDIATAFKVATSYEGQDILGIKIQSPLSPDNKDAIWIQGGIHAREWISPATVIYMTAQLLEGYRQNPKITELVDKMNWYIVPVLNVDGYNYTWTGDRLWRKTRTKYGTCFGADPNRNWDFHWCEEGASRDPCSDTYCGPSAFSEACVKGVADFLQQTSKDNFKAFIDFHSYSQLWMTPWGYSKEKPDDFDVQDQSSSVAVKALSSVYGTQYEHGTIANIIYVASGSSADWTYGKRGIKFSVGVELRDKGEKGFLLPADQIIPSGNETLQGLLAFADFVVNN